MIIAIDFDGTIVSGVFPRIEGLQPFAGDAIRHLKDDGHTIIINTCRSGNDAIAAVNYLLKEGIPFDVFNDNEPKQVEKYNNNSRKIYAHVYVDDKQVGGLPGWELVYSLIVEQEAKYQARLKKE